MLPETAASKVTAAHLSRTALLYVRQSSLKQVIHNTESAVRQYDLRGKAIALGWAADQITVIDIDQGQSGASAADREGFQHLVAEVSLGRAGIVLGLECSRLARNSADWHQLLELCGMTGTLICDEDGLYDPRNFNDRLLLGLKGALSEAELHLIRARLRGGILSKARRGELVMPLPVGLVYDAAGHVILDPDTAIQGALAAPVHHVRGHRVGHRRRESIPRRRAVLPLAAPQRTPQGRGRLAAAAAFHRAAGAAQPPLRRRVHLRPDREQLLPGRKRGSSITVPREEWISFIPGAHPGYITLDQWEANIARLSANAAAHGRDRAAGPPREGPALLQGIIICGRCGRRMTIRYHARGGKDLPTYLCQRDGIENARPICAAIPGHTLDERVGALLIATLTPLAVEAALQVSAELQQRAAEADALRAAHVERARYHADLARRRYLAVDPANRLVAGTLEADWNTALRALDDAQAAYDKAREQHTGTAHRCPEGPDRPARHRPARHLERPRHPDARTQAHRPAAAHRRHRHPHQRHHHRARPPGRRPAPHPHPASARTGLENPADQSQHHRRDRHAAGPPHLRRDRRHPPQPRPGQRRRTPLHPHHGPARHPHLPATQPPPAAARRRPDPPDQIAALLGVSTGTVKIWYHAGIVSGQRYNDKGEVLYHPPGPNPPARHQGRRHDTVPTCMNAT